mmetsp:Transcript_61969/g.128189  ORF Transcript_61969/g.128189 Transcript_61969/m.128189 type:complete len:218 (-) Transcript_61969:1423-2076(-)
MASKPTSARSQRWWQVDGDGTGASHTLPSWDHLGLCLRTMFQCTSPECLEVCQRILRMRTVRGQSTCLSKQDQGQQAPATRWTRTRTMGKEAGGQRHPIPSTHPGDSSSTSLQGPGGRRGMVSMGRRQWGRSTRQRAGERWGGRGRPETRACRLPFSHPTHCAGHCTWIPRPWPPRCHLPGGLCSQTGGRRRSREPKRNRMPRTMMRTWSRSPDALM